MGFVSIKRMSAKNETFPKSGIEICVRKETKRWF